MTQLAAQGSGTAPAPRRSGQSVPAGTNTGSARPAGGPHVHTVDDRNRALATRRALRSARTGLRSGELTLRTVMRERPDELADVLLIDVIRMARVRRSGAAVQEIGRRAVRDGINLMVPLGKASTASRAWVAQNGTYRLYGPRSAAR